MNYTMHIHTEAGKASSLVLSGFLTIQNCLAIHAELLTYAKEHAALQLEVKEVEEMDVTFLQLVVALARFQEQQQKSFTVNLDLNSSIKELVQLASLDKTPYLNIQ